MHTLKGHRQLELCTEPPPLVAAWLCCLVARLCPTFCDPVDCRVAVLQDYRLPGPPLSPRVCSHSCPLSQGCRPTIPSSAALFSFCPSSFLASGSLLMSRLFTSGGRSIGASISASVLPVNIQVRFPLGWTGLISLLSKGLSESSPAPHFKRINSSALWRLYSPDLIILRDHWEGHNLDYFVRRVISLLFNTLSRFVVAFLPRSKHLLISCLQSPSTVILEPKKRKFVITSTFSPSIHIYECIYVYVYVYIYME